MQPLEIILVVSEEGVNILTCEYSQDDSNFGDVDQGEDNLGDAKRAHSNLDYDNQANGNMKDNKQVEHNLGDVNLDHSKQANSNQGHDKQGHGNKKNINNRDTKERDQFINLIRDSEILNVKSGEFWIIVETCDNFICYEKIEFSSNSSRISILPKSSFRSKVSFFDVSLQTVNFNFLNKKPVFVFSENSPNEFYLIKKIKAMTRCSKKEVFYIFVGYEQVENSNGEGDVQACVKSREVSSMIHEESSVESPGMPSRKSIDKSNDKPSNNFSDKTQGKSSEKSFDNGIDKSNDKSSSKSIDKGIGKTHGKSCDKYCDSIKNTSDPKIRKLKSKKNSHGTSHSLGKDRTFLFYKIEALGIKLVNNHIYAIQSDSITVYDSQMKEQGNLPGFTDVISSYELDFRPGELEEPSRGNREIPIFLTSSSTFFSKYTALFPYFTLFTDSLNIFLDPGDFQIKSDDLSVFIEIAELKKKEEELNKKASEFLNKKEEAIQDSKYTDILTRGDLEECDFIDKFIDKLRGNLHENNEDGKSGGLDFLIDKIKGNLNKSKGDRSSYDRNIESPIDKNKSDLSNNQADKKSNRRNSNFNIDEHRPISNQKNDNRVLKSCTPPLIHLSKLFSNIVNFILLKTTFPDIFIFNSFCSISLMNSSLMSNPSDLIKKYQEDSTLKIMKILEGDRPECDTGKVTVFIYFSLLVGNYNYVLNLIETHLNGFENVGESNMNGSNEDDINESNVNENVGESDITDIDKGESNVTDLNNDLSESNLHKFSNSTDESNIVDSKNDIYGINNTRDNLYIDNNPGDDDNNTRDDNPRLNASTLFTLVNSRQFNHFLTTLILDTSIDLFLGNKDRVLKFISKTIQNERDFEKLLKFVKHDVSLLEPEYFDCQTGFGLDRSKVALLIYHSLDKSNRKTAILLKSLGRNDLASMALFSEYEKTKNTTILEELKETMGDYVFISDGRFISYESI